MALGTIGVTPGAGASLEVDNTSQGSCQVVKLAESALGSTSLIPATAANGLGVDLKNISAASVPVTNVAGGKLAVDGSGVTQPVSGAVAITGTPAVSITGTPNIGAVASITNPVTVTGTVSLSGTSTISGTMSANQGTAAAVAGAWPVKITDGANSVSLQNVGGVYSQPVKIMAGPATPLQTQNAPSSGVWRQHVAYTATQTGQAIRTPTSGKQTFVEGIVIKSSAGGVLKIYDSTNADSNMLFMGTLGASDSIVITPARPMPLSAVNNVLKYDSGTGAAGDITCWGYEQ